MKPNLVIITTIPLSLNFYKGQIGVLKEKFDVELISSFGTHLDNISRDEDVIGHSVEMTRDISIFRDFKSLLLLTFKLKQISPDMVLGSTPKAGLLSMISSWIVGVKHRVYYLHGLRYEGAFSRKKKLLQMMEKLSCYFATEVVSVSYGVRNQLEEDNITTKSVHVINNGSVNGINPAYFDRTLFGSSPKSNSFTIGYVGRLVRDKGVTELIRSFVEVLKLHQDCQLLLVGNYEDDLDPLDDDILNEIKSNDKIVELGFQADVRPFLAQMDVFVFPSYREGFGVSVMEALCMEVPVIVSDIIGCNEIVEHNSNGLIIPSKSASELTLALFSLLEAPEDLKKMRLNARASVVSRYLQEDVWKHTLKLYSSFVDK